MLELLNITTPISSSPIPLYIPKLPIPTSNHSTPRIFHGIGPGGGDPASGVFTSGLIPIGQGKTCNDLNGRKIPSGVHYVPGPDECTLCVCEDGGPKWCKAVLCSPPQDCKSFRVGSSCCDFICLDDSLNKGNGGKTGGPFNGPLDLADVVPKIIVVAITAILSLSLLLFLIHRLRQKQLQGRLNSSVNRRCDDCDDSRSMDFSLDFYDRGPPPPQYLAWWKPPSTYFPPRGEAPPPYEEAIASTSHCLPMTFTSVYNNNNTQVGHTNPNPPPTQPENGIATTSLTESNKSESAINEQSTTSADVPANQTDNSGSNPQQETNQATGESRSNPEPNAKSKHSNSGNSGVSSKRIFGRPKRYHSLGNGQGQEQAGPSSSRRRLQNETDDLRSGTSGWGESRSIQLPLTLPVISGPLPAPGLVPIHSRTGFPLVPPSYDDTVGIGRDYFRHSLTLPRRTEYLHPDRSSEYRNQQQQRFSLQFVQNPEWSDASSSTLSLSTPNSPNGLINRAPSLSSSSSSNV